MKPMFTRRGGALAIALAALAPALARAADSRRAVEAEIVAFRKTVVDAIVAKDAARLRTLYADDYTHAHGGGGVDDRATRIAVLIEGKASRVELLPSDELLIRTYGRDTAIVTGRATSTTPQASGRPLLVRWMFVYVRMDGRWLTAASQATQLPPGAV